MYFCSLLLNCICLGIAKVDEKFYLSMFTKAMRKTGGIIQKNCELVTYICDMKISIHTKYNTIFTQTQKKLNNKLNLP